MKWTATAIALGFAVPAGAQTVVYGPVDQPVATDPEKTEAVPPCPAGDGEEIVVCGRKGEAYRLPLPVGHGDRIVRGELPRASSKPIKVGGCGVVNGGAGCNGGIDPIAMAFFAIKVAHKLIDPDWEAEPPLKIPRASPGAERFTVPVTIIELTE